MDDSMFHDHNKWLSLYIFVYMDVRISIYVSNLHTCKYILVLDSSFPITILFLYKIVWKILHYINSKH